MKQAVERPSGGRFIPIEGGNTMKSCSLLPASLFLLAALVSACGPAQVSGAADPALAGLRLGRPSSRDNLTVIPVYSDRPESQEELVPLKEALEKKWLEIKETGEGEVSRVVLTNLSDKKIFILSGEVISGCKQDRMISGDRIIQPRQKNIDLDVFCVEAGRWTYESEGFFTKENLGTSTLREKAQRKSGDAQGEIWGEISRVNAENKVASASNAYQDIYDQKELKSRREALESELAGALGPAAVGVIVGIGGKVMSIDVFENKALFDHYGPLILKSSALAAVTSKESGELSAAEAAKVLASARGKTAFTARKNEKTGALEYLDGEINASSLKTDQGEVHFSVFPVEKEKTDEIRDININDNVNLDDAIQRR
jgi:hypothetical protein